MHHTKDHTRARAHYLHHFSRLSYEKPLDRLAAINRWMYTFLWSCTNSTLPHDNCVFESINEILVRRRLPFFIINFSTRSRSPPEGQKFRFKKIPTSKQSQRAVGSKIYQSINFFEEPPSWGLDRSFRSVVNQVMWLFTLLLDLFFFFAKCKVTRPYSKHLDTNLNFPKKWSRLARGSHVYLLLRFFPSPVAAGSWRSRVPAWDVIFRRQSLGARRHRVDSATMIALPRQSFLYPPRSFLSEELCVRSHTLVVKTQKRDTFATRFPHLNKATWYIENLEKTLELSRPWVHEAWTTRAVVKR